MEIAIDIFAQLGSVLVMAGGGILAALAWAWGVVWAVAFGLFWLAVLVLVCATAIAIVRPTALKTDDAPSSTVDQLRAALRTGELDAEIARINARNASRGRV